MTDSARLRLNHRRASRELGGALGRSVCAGDVVVLSGELGAGKTFVVRAACRAVGVPPAIAVQSPTFALAHDYPGGRLPVVHVDAYRMRSERELDDLGLDERLEEGAVCFVEWGAPYVGALGGDALEVRLELDGDARSASLHAGGARSERLLASVLRHLARRS